MSKELGSGGYRNSKNDPGKENGVRKEAIHGDSEPESRGRKIWRKFRFGKGADDAPREKIQQGKDLLLPKQAEETPQKVKKTAETMIYPPEKKTEERTKEQQAVLREYKKKSFFLRKAFGGESEPATDEGKALIKNVSQMRENSKTLENQPKIAEVKKYITSRRTLDPFEVQKHAATFTAEMLKGTESIDMADLAMGTIESMQAIEDFLPQGYTETMNIKTVELQKAVIQELVNAVPDTNLYHESLLPISEIYEDLFGPEKAINPIKTFVKATRDRIQDKFSLYDVIKKGNLQNIEGEASENEYSKPASEGELNRLNTVAADTLESLHLLKAYGVTSFEVSGDKLHLPWDVAVIPPLADIRESESFDVYAEGAVADFLLLPKDQNRSDIRFRILEPDDSGTTQIGIGDSDALMRFRLHDNGQISYGAAYINIPSDITQQNFEALGASESYQRLRGLFIALASDALIPDNITSGEDIGGSVASQFPERPKTESAGQRITELLLRRRKAFRRAEVSERQRKPKDWDAPQTPVAGHKRKLLPGTQRRSDAEELAREYHDEHNLHFEGLPEGYTWVKPHTRSTESPVTYRRARFRKNTSTQEFLDSL